jgi:4,5-dihydroxyphthalate decarboxylase
MSITFPKSGPVKLKSLLGENPSTKSFKSGAIKSDLVSFDYDEHKLIHHGFKPMIREGRYDFGELAITTFLQAKSLGKPLVLLPAVIGARFQHHCAVYNADKGELKPTELNGKRIGVRSYPQTTVLWIRGILQNDYGMDPDKVKWTTFEDGHLSEFRDPPNAVRAPEGKKMNQMLIDGELDVILVGNGAPEGPQFKTVIPDPKAAAKDWYARTGAIPMNHMAVVRKELSEQRPDIVRELYRMLLASRDADTKPSADGLQMRQFGLENLRKTLELAVQYARQQKLLDKDLSVDDLFDETTRTLGA